MSISSPDAKTLWIALAHLPSWGPSSWHRALSFFNNDITRVWHASADDLVKCGIRPTTAQTIVIERSQLDITKMLAKLESTGVKCVTLGEEDYPPLLAEIYQPPAVLFYRGNLRTTHNLCLAVVGTRSYTPYGQRVVEDLIGQLTNSNLTIVSGLALGIDALAHYACVRHNINTVAVLGAGVEESGIYPSSNRLLAKKIIEQGGCLLAEYPPGTEPTRFSFPLRNRIIAGLARGTLVIEAADSSGSLITAKCALDYNREVFAVPGSIYNSQSIGTNQLIKQGAHPVVSVNDLVENLNLSIIAHEARIDLDQYTAEEQNLIRLLSPDEPYYIDKLAHLCKIKVNALSGTLAVLEMQGIIKDVGGKHYIRTIKF